MLPPNLRDLEIHRASKSLRKFTELAWAAVEKGTDFEPGWHIDAICDHLEAVRPYGHIHDLILNMPPRHMKSLLVSVFWPVWVWINVPHTKWLFASYSGSLALRDATKCRRLVESPWFQRHWGDRFQLMKDQNAKQRFDTTESGYRLSTSVGGSVMGEGGDVAVIDDAHNGVQAQSPTLRRAVEEWFRQSWSTRLNDQRTGSRVVVGQRLHEDDLPGILLRDGGWDHLCLPAEFEPERRKVTSIGWSDPRTKAGELLWPKRFGPDELQKLKVSLGTYAAAGQLQQSPAPAEGGIFKKNAWKRWNVDMQLPKKFDLVIHSWDLAFGKSETSSFVVGQLWAVKGLDFFLIDQYRAQVSFTETRAACRAENEKALKTFSRIHATLVELKANGAAIVEELGREISGVIPINPQGSKEARAVAFSPHVDSGHVFLPPDSHGPWVSGFIERCAAFPNGSHDDEIDAMSQAGEWLLSNAKKLLNIAFDPKEGYRGPSPNKI